jgi:hypothetical protein
MHSVPVPLEPIVFISIAGFAGGLGMLVRGLGSYGTANRISDTAGSRISSVAAGEARLTGVVEPAELLLISPLQSAKCVYYRASVDESRDDTQRNVFREERAVGFRLRDETGTIRVFPRGARWAIPERFSDHTAMLGDQPSALDIRTGPAIASGSQDREAAIAQLLTVEDTRSGDPRLGALMGAGHRSYRESRIEPGDLVTIVGFAEPFDQLPDPTAADLASFADGITADPLADPAIAADLAAARAAGELADSPEEAWGNAAIPGFGIGRPVRAPDLEAGANALPLADAETAARIEREFEIAPETLVVTATPDVPLLVTLGAPGLAAGREQGRFLMGLVGAVVAIASAMALAVIVTNQFAL